MSDHLKTLENSVKKKITQGKIDAALHLIIKFVSNIIADTRATAKVFSSKILDELCQEIGAKTLLDKGYFAKEISNNENEIIIYIATELYVTGGHTAVLEDFIKFQPHKKHLVLITNALGSGINDSVINRFSPLSVEIDLAPNGSHLDKLHWLQERLILHQPNQVFLFNHHQDAIAIAAVKPNLASQLIFYHHCDHNLCLGLYLAHALHIDPHSLGYYNCRNNLGVTNNIYIPLIAEDLNNRPENIIFLADGKLRTCSSGGMGKFEKSYSYKYTEEVPKILAITGGYHIHIGHLSQQYRNSITKALEKKGIGKDKFIYIPWVKSVWKAMHDHRVDAYIVSFPIGGGRTSVEVMGSGTPIIVHQNYHSSFFGGAEIIYSEAFSWRYPEELYSCLISLDQETLIKQSSLSRRHYENYHTHQIFLECLEGIKLEKETVFPPQLKKYFLDDLRSYLDYVSPFKLGLQRSQTELEGMMRNIWFNLKMAISLTKK